MGRLKILWNQPTPAVVPGTPRSRETQFSTGTPQGNFFALDAATGSFAGKPPSLGRLHGEPDRDARAGCDRRPGNRLHLWSRRRQRPCARKIRPNTLGRPAIWGSGTRSPSTSPSVWLPTTRARRRRSSRGVRSSSSIPNDGRVIWQTYTISDADYANGSTGSSIWTSPASTPTAIRFTSVPATTLPSLAKAPVTRSWPLTRAPAGQVGQSSRTGGRHLDTGFPVRPDSDFGDSPQLYRLPDGRKVVGDGQKTGSTTFLTRRPA